MKYLVDKTDRISTSLYIQSTDQGFKILSDEEGAALVKDDKLPDDVCKETAFWMPETWEIASYIEENAMVTDPQSKEKSISPKKYLELKIQCLLKDWTLKDSDPKLTLKFNFVMGTNIEIIEHSIMGMIKQLDRTIIEALYTKFLRTGKRVDLKNLKSVL